MISFDCVFLTKENADTTLEYENEPSLEVFQEVTIYSCVEVVVRTQTIFRYSIGFLISQGDS